MKKVFSLVLIALFAVFAFVSLQRIDAAGENLVTYGDFEGVALGNLGDPANEQGFGSGNWDSYVQIVEDAEKGHVAKFSYTVESKGFCSFFKFVSGIEAGKTYVVEFDYKVEGSTDNFGLRLAPIQGTDTATTFYSGAATEGWQHAKLEFVAAADTEYDSIGVWFNTASSTDNAGYMDNIVMKEKVEETSNLVSNGDFEGVALGNLGDPANEQGFGSGNWDSYVQIVEDAEKGHVAKFSYTVESKGFCSFFKFVSGIEAGKTYVVEFDYKVEGSTDNFGIRFAPVQGTDTATVFYSGAATEGWQHKSLEIEAVADTEYDSIGVWFNTASSTDNVGYLDNIVIKEKEEEAPVTPPTDSNLVSNGDFEGVALGNLGDPANDQGFGSGNWDSYVQIVEDAEKGHVAKFSYTVESKGFCSFFKFVSGIEAGKTYVVEFDYKVEGSTDNFGIRLAPIQGTDTATTFYSGAATEGWQHAKLEFVAAADTEYDSIGVWFNSGSDAANAGYMDNIVMKEKVEETSNLVTFGDLEDVALGSLGAANAQGFGSGNWDSHAEVVEDTEKGHVIKFSYTEESKGYCSIFKFVTGITAGKTYVVEFDYKVEGSTDNFGLRLAPIMGDDTAQTFYSGAATEGWQHAKLEFVAAADTEYDSIGVWFNTASSTENAGYMDNISIVEKEEETPVTPPTDPEPENPFKEDVTYYASKTTTVNGDFEKFDEGLVFTEEQAEGAWGSVSLDMPGVIKTVDGSKVVELTKRDDVHTYASFFLMLPDTLEVGDMLRITYDIKLVIKGEAASYTAIDSCLVGGSNKSYYLIDYKQIALAAGNNNKTSGAETIHYPVSITDKGNGWFTVSIDIQLTNKDLIQTNSIRWLFTPKSTDEFMYIDNVNIYSLSETPFVSEVSSVAIEQGASINLDVNATSQLTAKINPTDAETTLTWTSSNPAVATVDENGLVTAVKAGACSITVTTANGKTAEIAIIVKAAEQPKQEEKGCGGTIAASIISVVSLVGCAFFFAKKREEK